VATVTVAPNADEWALGPAELEAIVIAFQAEGHTAWLQEPRDGNYSAGGIVTDPIVDLSLFLWENVGQEVVSVIVGIAIDKVRRQFKRKRKATVILYGPKGEVLRTVELPADDDADGSSR
jgi:hypothetical protein